MAKWQLFFLILCASAAVCQTEVRPSIAAASAGGKSETDQKIESLQLKVKTAPGNYAGYDELGLAFFQKARENVPLGDCQFQSLLAIAGCHHVEPRVAQLQRRAGATHRAAHARA